MEKINVAELLKDCPKGMELDCTIFEDVYFDYVSEFNIIHCYIQYEKYRTSIIFNQHGTHNSDIKSKCVIFPKGKTTWEGFQRPFKDGDILAYTSSYTTVFIYRNKGDEAKYATSFYVGHTIGVCYCNFHIYNKYSLTALNGDCNVRFATEEEKAKLFKAIKDNGYKWNPETKILEKLIEPKFKVGDRIRHKCPEFRGERTITSYDKSGYWTSTNDWIDYENQDDWELVPDKFDINTLKPFDKVLVRDGNNEPWVNAFFGFCDPVTYKRCIFVTGNENWCQCIPYEGNEHLLGTTDDCGEYFKTWKL